MEKGRGGVPLLCLPVPLQLAVAGDATAYTVLVELLNQSVAYRLDLRPAVLHAAADSSYFKQHLLAAYTLATACSPLDAGQTGVRGRYDRPIADFWYTERPPLSKN